MKYVILAAFLAVSACSSIQRDPSSDVEHTHPLSSDRRAN
jgi:hypothetical protein